MDKSRKVGYTSYMDEQIYIYALIDPRNGEYRYIGSSNNPEKRREYHASQGERLKRMYQYGIRNVCYRDVWLADLKASGVKPELKLIEQCAAKNRFKRERFWVQFFMKRGCVLVNGNLTGRKWRKKRWTAIPTPQWFKDLCYNVDFERMARMDNI